MLLAVLLGWLEREQRDVIAFLREENRTLKAQLSGRRLQLNDEQRRRLAVLGQRLGRAVLREVATLFTPDTILRWHRELIARKWTYARRRPGRPGVLAEIRRLVLRMATENPSWGYTRIQGALKNVGHRVARSTIASILKAEGIPPSRERPSSWRTFLRAHWSARVAADFFTTEVWTARGLVTYYTLFVLELQSRRVLVTGSTPYPDEAFVVQAMRNLANAIDGILAEGCVLICESRSQVEPWRTGIPLNTRACESFEHRSAHPTATRTQSDSFGRSRRSASNA
jgi:putative transposase